MSLQHYLKSVPSSGMKLFNKVKALGADEKKELQRLIVESDKYGFILKSKGNDLTKSLMKQGLVDENPWMPNSLLILGDSPELFQALRLFHTKK